MEAWNFCAPPTWVCYTDKTACEMPQWIGTTGLDNLSRCQSSGSGVVRFIIVIDAPNMLFVDVGHSVCFGYLPDMQ